MNEFKLVTLSRDDLQKALEAFDENKDYVHFGLEMDSINGDQILWVDNGKSGDNRKYIRINKPHKNKDK